MKAILDYIVNNQFTAMLAAFVALGLCYFMIKKIVKLGLLLILIVLAVGGYYYFKSPKQEPQNFRQTLQEARDKSATLLGKSKHAYQKGKELMEKSKELTHGAANLLKKREIGQDPEK